MQKIFLSFFLLTGIYFSLYSQKEWKVGFEQPKCFIENKGQFDEYANQQTGAIVFGADFGKAKVFFGNKGISYVFLEAEKSNNSTQNTKVNGSLKDHKQWEKTCGKYNFRHDEINVHFATPKELSLNGLDQRPDYFSYTIKGESGNLVNLNEIKGFEKIVYTDVAPGIDLEYTLHPESGLKYALILDPHADINLFKMVFDRDFELINQDVHFSTMFGDLIDHAPLSFYEHADSAIIPSEFKIFDKRTLGFHLGPYQHENKVIIDPWTQLPSFASNWDCVWECDKDAAGNIYAIGGVMPMQLLKYNAAGALQWTYSTPYDTSNVWLGTLAVDNLGNSYVTAGSIAAIQKINTAGSLVWNNPNPGGVFSSDEFWSISFNCDQSNLVVGGTGGAGLTLLATIYNIDISNGNVLNSADVAQGSTFGFPPSVQEVRGICASPNGKYYFLTQDTVGAVSQNFNACGGSSLFYKIDNSYDFGYKCENFRYDNSGICAIKANNNFYYTQNGINVAKRNLQTGAIITTAPIPGGANTTALGDFSVANSGLDIDNCGNVYVGSSTGVIKYDANLTQMAVYPTNFKVYDVHVLPGGDVVAGGSTGTNTSATRTGYLQTFSASACAPMTSSCCDASICSVQNVCVTDAPIQLTAATAGGTWSGPGISATGLFTPANAGVGTQNITYTLACGSETISIIVSPCQGLTACVEANGSITVSGGVAPYSWAFYQAAQNTPITNQTECQNCGYTWFFGQCLNGVTPVTSCATPAQWVQFATGLNATAPNGVTQVQVTDAGGTVQVFVIANLAPCNPNPCPTIIVSVSNFANVTCYGLADGESTIGASGGTGPYSYNWIPGNLNGPTQTGLSPGTYTITATDTNNCTGDTSITITEPNELLVNAVNITGTQCGSSTGSIDIGVIGGSGNYSFAWNPNVGSSAFVQNLAGGAYSVVVTDQATGCSVTGQFNVPSLGGPVLNNPVVTDVLCFGDATGSIMGSAGGSTPPYQFQLDGGTAQASGLFSGLAAGSYVLTAIDATGCENTLTVNITEPSDLTINVQGGLQICSGDTTLLTANVGGGVPAYSYLWSTGENGTSIGVTSTINTTIQLTVTDANGCSEVKNTSIEIIPCGNIEWFIPNVFSPNGDGFNDEYGIYTVNAVRQEAIIVNRWGELMVELNTLNQMWNGILPDGKEATEGAYFMKYRIYGLAGEEQQGHLFFHLVR